DLAQRHENPTLFSLIREAARVREPPLVVANRQVSGSVPAPPRQYRKSRFRQFLASEIPAAQLRPAQQQLPAVSVPEKLQRLVGDPSFGAGARLAYRHHPPILRRIFGACESLS